MQTFIKFIDEKLQYIIQLHSNEKSILTLALDSVPNIIDLLISLQNKKYKINNTQINNSQLDKKQKNKHNNNKNNNKQFFYNLFCFFKKNKFNKNYSRNNSSNDFSNNSSNDLSNDLSNDSSSNNDSNYK